MKHLLLIAFLITGTVVYAQKNSLPDMVKTTFEDKYPDAEKVKIKARKDTYTIRFVLNEKQTEAIFKEEGAWVKTETRVPKSELPDMVISAISKKYSKGTYSKAVYCEQSEGGNYYLVDVDTPAATIYLEIDSSGKILKTEKVDKQDEGFPENKGDSRDDNDGGGE